MNRNAVSTVPTGGAPRPSAPHKTDGLGPSVWSSPLLRGLREEDLKALLDICRVAHAERDHQLLRAESDNVALIARGAAKAHAATRTGDQVITALLGPGDAWGFGVALGYLPSDTDVTAIQPVDALIMPGQELRSLLLSRPAITAACLRTVGRQLALSQAESLRFAGTTTRERVTHRIFELAQRWGRVDGDRVAITLPLTQDELAAWAASSRESTAKVLHSLRRSGIVRTGRRSLIVLDIARLEDRCRERPTESVLDLVGNPA